MHAEQQFSGVTAGQTTLTSMTGVLKSRKAAEIIDLTETSPQDLDVTADVIEVDASPQTEDTVKRLEFLRAFDEDEFTAEIDDIVDDPDLQRHT